MDGDAFAVRLNAQKAGFLYKKPFGHNSTKWSKRFFVLKDGFMLYYGEKEGKQSADNGAFNIHPKGVVPLGGCWAEPLDGADRDFAFSIRHPDFGDGTVFLAAESAEACEDWLRWVRECSRVTYRNAQIGETMIQCLKAKTEVREQQQEETRTKLDAESEALREEQERRALVEEQLEQLRLEKEQADQMAQQLMMDQTNKEQQLEQTAGIIRQIEEKKAMLEAKTMELEQRVAEASNAAETTSGEAQRLLAEKEELSKATRQLVKSLKSMEKRATSLEEERLAADAMLQQARAEAEAAAAEMAKVTEARESLQSELGQAMMEKEVALKAALQEQSEREKLEKKLQMAEDSLKRLDAALRKSGVKVDVDIEADVKTLKGFFETVLTESYWDAHRDRIMKEAVTARPLYDRFGREL